MNAFGVQAATLHEAGLDLRGHRPDPSRIRQRPPPVNSAAATTRLCKLVDDISAPLPDLGIVSDSGRQLGACRRPGESVTGGAALIAEVATVSDLDMCSGYPRSAVGYGMKEFRMRRLLSSGSRVGCRSDLCRLVGAALRPHDRTRPRDHGSGPCRC